jgi:hypothetical protein
VGKSIPFEDIRRRAEWLVEKKAKPALLANGHYDPVVFVFGGHGFLNAVNLSVGGDRPMREEVLEAVDFSGGTAFVFARDVSHPQRGAALLVRLEHPEGRILWCTPFTRGEPLVLHETEVLEGERVAGPWEEALWRL